MNYLFVMLGGAIGAMSRYVVGLLIQRKFSHPPLPLAMVIVNVIGSFGLGLFSGNFISVSSVDLYENSLFLIIGIGFFGAFTTFSTFSVEATQLLRDRKWKIAALYILLTTILSIVFFAIGYRF